MATVKADRGGRLICQLPKDCRICNAINPASEWTYDRLYLAQAVDALNIMVWQNNGKKHAAKPESVIPQFIQKEAAKGKHKDTAVMDIDDIKALLSKPRK